jgi:hypothetical protein
MNNQAAAGEAASEWRGLVAAWGRVVGLVTWVEGLVAAAGEATSEWRGLLLDDDAAVNAADIHAEDSAT